MPAKERRRGDEEGAPSVPRDRPAHGREKRPVDEPETRLAAGPLEHPELMAQDEDLEILGPAVSATCATADNQPGERPDDEVYEEPHQPIVPAPERESGFSTPTG
jgi:hypothetical protein